MTRIADRNEVGQRRLIDGANSPVAMPHLPFSHTSSVTTIYTLSDDDMIL
jgi:hypothetical protein